MASKPNKTEPGKQTTLGPLELVPTPVLEGPITSDAICTDVQRRETVYGPYVDFHMKPEHEELAAALGDNPIRVGYPMRLNSESALGRLATKFGVKAGADGKVNLEHFRGTRWDCTFVREEREVTDKDGSTNVRRFWAIEKDSVRPSRQK